jgi:hypothetical protein
MSNNLFVFVFIFLTQVGFAQVKSPVSWQLESKMQADGKINLKATATMQDSWVTYSQFTDENGPIPTSFEVDGVTTKFVESSKVIKEYDEMFEVNVLKFKEKATFDFIAEPSAKGKKVSITYMTCDGSRCLAPVTVDLDIKP